MLIRLVTPMSLCFSPCLPHTVLYRGSAGACASKCVLFNDPDDCGVGPIVENRNSGLTYQFMEPDMSGCH